MTIKDGPYTSTPCLVSPVYILLMTSQFIADDVTMQSRDLTIVTQRLNLPHQNRLWIGTKPAFSFWINISTVSEVRCDCQGLGLVARIEASILVIDTIQVLYRPVLGQIQFCSFDRRCKTCLDTKPVLYQGRFCSLLFCIKGTMADLIPKLIAKYIVTWNTNLIMISYRSNGRFQTSINSSNPSCSWFQIKRCTRGINANWKHPLWNSVGNIAASQSDVT